MFDDNETIDNCAQIKLSGEMTISRVGELKHQLVESCKNVDSLDVDLSEVAAIDSAGLQLLFALKFSHKSITFTTPSQTVLRATELFNLTDLLITGAPCEGN